MDQSQYNKAGSYQAILELASYYYNNGRYDEAITYYDKISDFNQLSDLELSELSFKRVLSFRQQTIWKS